MKADHEDPSTTLAADQIEQGSRLLIQQSIQAHTVNQTINLHPPGAQRSGRTDREVSAARLERFHTRRVNEIASGSAPVALLGNGTLVLHLLPFSSVDKKPTASFEDISHNEQLFLPIRGSSLNARVDYEGLLTASNSAGIDEPQRAYVRVFRSGAFESVVSSLGRGYNGDYLPLPDIHEMIIEYVSLYANALVIWIATANRRAGEPDRR